MKLVIDILVPGHGRLVKGKENINAIFQEVLTNTKNYKTLILDNLSREKKKCLNLMDLSKLVFPDSIAYNAYSRVIIVYNVLRSLLKEEKVDFFVNKNKSYWFLKN
jgi:hypothetical protein